MMQKSRKIFLLYPPISMEERYSSKIGAAGGQQAPLGIYYLASFLRNKGYEVMAIDGEAMKLTSDAIVKLVEEFNPSFIGISSTTVAFHRSVQIAGKLKTTFPDKPIILGGPHITSNYAHAMSFSEFSFGVVAEGEETLHELLETLIAEKSHEEILGIVFTKDGKMVKTCTRPYIEDLDTIPFPAMDLVADMSVYTPPPNNYKTFPVASMITTRGCPSLCTFCDNNTFGRKTRFRSAKNIVDEIEQLYKIRGIREISFVDDTFLLKKKRIYEIFDLLKQRGISITWSCASRIMDIDLPLIKYIKEHGCWNIAFGIESGDEEILKKIKKPVSLDLVRRNIGYCNDNKIKSKGFFIVGHPGETMESINKTIRFAKELPLDEILVTINTPIPGTVQYNEADNWGSFDKTDWSKFNYWRPVFVPNGLTKEILIQKQKQMYRDFYLRPRTIYRVFTSFFGRGGLKRFLTLLSASRFLFFPEKAEA